MDLLSDVAFLSRLQFTLIVAFHFVFVPLSIGIGLITAIAQTRYYRSGDEKDEKAAWFWVKVFTTTFAVGVASGIAMEFSFGTNWADYSRFVGDIFGAPLAAEAGLPYPFEEAVESTQTRELDDSELDAVAGGSWCVIIGGGHDNDSNTVDTENGVGVTGFGTCDYVGIGIGVF